MIPRRWLWPRQRLAEFSDRITLVEAVFDELPEVLARLAQPKVQGILLDLGVSSLQIDDPERGFAYAQDAPLDMRMGPQELTAAEVLNTYSKSDLARILRSYGEERFADRIAGRIVAEREREPFRSSARLVRLLYDAIPAASRKSGGHPAKRTFQALRIEVNGELRALESVLPEAIAALALRGRIVVLAYHSLEDRLVKQILGRRLERSRAAGPARRAGRAAAAIAAADPWRDATQCGRDRPQPACRVRTAPCGRTDRRAGGGRMSALWAPITGRREEIGTISSAAACRGQTGAAIGAISFPVGVDRNLRDRHGRPAHAQHDAARPGVPVAYPQPPGHRARVRPG